MKRHWIDRMAGRSILLEDSAEPVPHHDLEDRETWVSVFIRGASLSLPVFCGPAAPFPQTSGAEDTIAWCYAKREVPAEVCGARGPDGRCELNPRHVTLPEREDRLHAATTDEGLVRW